MLAHLHIKNLGIIEEIDIEYVTTLLNEGFKEEYYAMSIVNPIGEKE